MANSTTLPADERPVDSARELLHMLRVSPRHVTEATNDARVTQVCKRLLDLESDENSYTLTITKLREENERLREVLAEMATTPPLGSSVHREWDKRIARARAVLRQVGGEE